MVATWWLRGGCRWCSDRRCALSGTLMKNLLLSGYFGALPFRRICCSNSHLRKDRFEKCHFGLCDVIRTVVILLVANDRLSLRELQAPPASPRKRAVPHSIGCSHSASGFCTSRALKLGDACARCACGQAQRRLVSVFRMLFLGERLALPKSGLAWILCCGGSFCGLPSIGEEGYHSRPEWTVREFVLFDPRGFADQRS